MAERQRKHQLKIYLDEEELKLFQDKLNMSGSKNMAEFIRKCVLEKSIFVVDMSPFYELQHLLGNQANNLNQIAKRVNSTGIIYKDDIHDIKKMNEDFSYALLNLQKILLNSRPKGSD